MDLLRALDVLSTSPIDTDDHSLRKEKIEACRTIAEQICSPSIRNNSDFPRFLSIAISLLLRAHGDKDLNVYSVAEESLNRTIKILIYTYHERILFELFRVLKGRSVDKKSTGSPNNNQMSSSFYTSGSDPSGSGLFVSSTTSSGSGSGSGSGSTSGNTNSPNYQNVISTANIILSKPFPIKSQRIALTKFGEVCQFIRPAKSRKYITSLLAPINQLLAMGSDEALQESIAIAMESISRVLISYLKEQEVTQFIDVFTKNLSHHSAAVRRSASFCIVSICRYYPKPLYERTIDTLHTLISSSSTSSTSSTVSPTSPTASSPSIEHNNINSNNSNNSNRTLGVLFSYLQLVKLSDEYIQNGSGGGSSSGGGNSGNFTGSNSSGANGGSGNGADGYGCNVMQSLSIEDYFVEKLSFFVQFIVKQMKMVDQEIYDHNVVGASLELLQQLLVSFGRFDYAWPKPLVQQAISQLRSMAFNATSNIRVSLKAVVINCLAQSVKYFPRLFYEEFYEGQPPVSMVSNLSISDISFKLYSDTSAAAAADGQHHQQQVNRLGLSTSTQSTQSFTLDSIPKEEFLQYLSDSDPLLRGSTALLIGCLLRGFLEADHITSNSIYPGNQHLLQDYLCVPYLMAYLLRSLLDSSSITAKLACTGVGECLPTLSLSRFSDWALVALRHLLCVSSSTYWLVKLEILETLSKIDYVVIEFLEQNIQQKAHILCTTAPADKEPESGGAIAIPIQPKVLDFLIEQLGDNDFRVRNSAGNALVNIIPKLVFTAPLERRSMKGIASKVRETFDAPGYENIITKKTKILANLSHVISLICSKLSNPHPEDMIRGCYHALKLICQQYSFPLFTPDSCKSLTSTLPNQMLSFVGDILPLALDRVGIVTWMATDFDLHIDIIEILAYLSRGAENVLGAYCQNVLRHICRMINIMSNIVQFRPTPPLKEVKPVSSASAGLGSSSPLVKAPAHLGAFTHSIHYIKVYSKLFLVRQNSITIFGVDKFSQLRQSCFDALAVILRCSGKAVLPYTEEILGYLTSHFEQEPLAVTNCITELFLVTFKPTPIVSMSNLSLQPRLSKEYNPNPGSTSMAPRAIETTHSQNTHDEMFNNEKSVFSSFLTMGSSVVHQYYEQTDLPSSHSLNYSYSSQEVARITSSDEKRLVFKQFEALIRSCLVEYQSTHNLELKKSILSMLAKFARFGLDLSQFDKDPFFASYLLEELKETQCLMLNPVDQLPYVMDAVGSMFLTRKMAPEIFNAEEIKKVTYDIDPIATVAKHPPSYSTATIIGSCHSLVRYLYDPSDKYPDQDLRDGFLKFMLANLHQPQTVELALTLINNVRNNNALYTKCSQAIVPRLFAGLALNETPYFVVTSIRDVHRIYTLIDRLHPSAVTPVRWADALLSVSPEFVATGSITNLRNDPLKSKRTLLIRERLLEEFDLRWLPVFVILLRTGVKIPEETRISAARQSIYLPSHDNKHNPSPAANIISQIIFKLLRNAVSTFAKHKPSYPIFSELINHMLYYAGLFFNRNLIPNNPKPHLFLQSFKSVIDPSLVSDIIHPLLNFGGTSVSIHAVRFLMLLGREHEDLTGYAMSPRWQVAGCEHFLTHHVIFLQFCQSIIINRQISASVLTESVLDKMVLLINEPTVKRLVDTAKDDSRLAAVLSDHLSKIFNKNQSLDLRRKQKLLRLLSYLPTTRDTIEMLIIHFLQTDDISLQIAGERILNLSINRLIDNTKTVTDSLEIIQQLYKLFMSNFFSSTTNLAIQSTFIKLIKNLSTPTPLQTTGSTVSSPIINNTPSNGFDITKLQKPIVKQVDGVPMGFENLCTIAYSDLIELLKSQYYSTNHRSFTQLCVLAQIDRDAVTELLESNKLDSSLIPSFIASPYSTNFELAIQEHLERKISALLSNSLGEIGSDPLRNGPPLLSDAVWEELRETTRCLSSFINKFGSASLHEAQLLKISIWTYVESFRRWRAEVINPYDFKLVLELSRSIIFKSSASILTITDDFSWCSLLLCLYKFYCLVIRPHFGYILGQRELEENYSQDPTQISLTQSNEMVKFLVSLLCNQSAYKPMNGSHIGQFIFDSFIRAISPLSTKAIEFVYPALSQTTAEEAEYGGGIIPNCPLFANALSPEQNLEAFIRYIKFVGIPDDYQFNKIWEILEPIFFAPLGDAEMGSDEITEESKCLALNGITMMIIKACFETSDLNAPVNLLETSNIPSASYNHIPREKDIIFLSTNSGKKLNRLLSIIYGSMPQSELPLGGSIELSTPTDGNSDSISSYHFNIERSFSNLQYTSGQISLADLRQFRTPVHLGINFTPIIEKLKHAFETFIINAMCPPLLRKEILKTVILLSDLFNREQFTWMYRIFQAIYNNLEDNDDFLLKQHLVLGICKGLAVIQPDNTTTDPQYPQQVFEILKQSLEHPNISVQQSALDGILYLLEGKVNRFIQGPLLQFLFRWIPARLSTSPFPPIPLTLRVLATMFLLIEQYSRESEENSFTKRAVVICTTLGQNSIPLPIVYGIFRGLDRLLVSFSLSHSQREYISHFAMKSLPLDNPIRSLMGLALMVTCMYTGDETGSSTMTPSINGKNPMMASPNSSSNSLAFSGGAPFEMSPTLSFSSDSGLFEQEDSMFNIDSTERQHFSQVNNMEKVKMLFDKIKLVSHYSYETYVLSEVIPTVIVDLYPSVDQILSANELTSKIQPNDQLFSIAASEFYNNNPPDNQKNFAASFSKKVQLRLLENDYHTAEISNQSINQI
ncbi:Huntingtin family protein [Heterostelium album PN500]|uniref:Huntingtin family protein n=1 Tax=Heterostelium pallidum (strain ATCC 26659 / Pp 5 / PN500) TaxID=670386 RepID=D3B5E8_HETP5|nr:Huntingtin family protein [Heterostelium album PN500]EFA83096.1 Huntingtin family protein [Heterostelium album PN500]|eukprot:XP_020435213.1 Huntingtin family protein [Heterostelium album PN500]